MNRPDAPQPDTQEADSPLNSESASLRFPKRGVLLGALLAFPNAHWIVTIEAVQYGPYITTLALLSNVLFWLVWIQLANGLLRRFLPRHALLQADLLAIYSILAVSSAITGCDLLQILMHMIGHPVWANGIRQGYSESFLSHVPQWLTVTDPEALKGYYLGNSTMYRLEVLKAWMTPLAAWMFFILLMTTAMMCLNVIFRRRWINQERLSFPIMALPIEMTTSQNRLWRNPLFWIGFAIAGGIDLWNGFSFLYPSMPFIPIGHINIQPFFPNKPWSAMGWTTISFYPIVVGIGYLLPLDLLFSYWVFFLFWKAQPIFANAYGYDITPDFPYVSQQGIGGILMLGFLTIWGARGYLKEVWKHIRGRPSDVDDQGEPIPYRAAFIGFCAAFAGLVVFARLAGLSWLWAVVFFALYTVVILTVTRLRAELGAPVHDFPNGAPELILTDALGPATFAPRDLTVMSLFYWFSKLHRGDIMPHGMEALKLAEGGRARTSHLFWTMFAAVPLGAIVGFWSMMHQGYALGNAAKWSFPAYSGWEAFDRLNSWLSSPKPPDSGKATAMLIGAWSCLGLFLLRRNFLWFPLNPIGYASTATFQTNIVWLPLFMAWVLKGATLRWGGRPLYHRLLPFFFGLILGQAIFGSFWSLVSVFTGRRMYSFWGY